MKNATRVLSTIALAGMVLTAAANSSFAAYRPHPVNHKASTMKHKKAGKKTLINLERRKNGKSRKPRGKNGAITPAISQT